MVLESADVRAALDGRCFHTVFQPIYSLRTGRVAGLEALTRFTQQPHVGPGEWFRVAHGAGLGVELELATLRCALETAAATALPTEVGLWGNLSPAALVEPATLELLAERPTGPLVIEVTEQSSADGYAQLLEQLDGVRGLGVGVAVDDVGRKRVSYRNLRRLRPNHIKADLAITATLDGPRPRRWVAGSLARVARRHGAGLVAEGVETPAQLRAWQRFGADLAQGFFLAAPSPLDEALQAPPIAAARDDTALAG